MSSKVAESIAPEVRRLLSEAPSRLPGVLSDLHEEDLADLLELLEPDEAGQVLQCLPTEDAGPIMERLDEEAQEAMVTTLGPDAMAPIVSEMAPDDRADFIEALPEAVGDEVLESLEKVDPEAAAEVEELAKWPEDSAGGLMTTDYLSVGPNATVAEIIQGIRDVGGKAETIYYVYVVDEAERLLGVVSLRDLLLAVRSDDIVRDIMTENVFDVGPSTDQEDVARRMAKYDFSALPVVSEDRKLLGVITFDDIMDVMTQEHAEDVQRFAGVAPSPDGYLQTSFWQFIGKRAPWLAILFVGEFFAGNAMRRYDDVLHTVAALAFYVPLLISTGGNSGSQTASLVIRALAVGELTEADWWKVLRRELTQGLVLGLILAALGMARVAIWGDGTAIMWSIGATLVGITMMGCTVGAMFPLFLRKIGLDPATSSTPFIATVVDVLGIIIYFNIAMFFLGAATGR